MKQIKRYGAIPSVVNPGKYLVAEIDLYNYGTNRVMGNIRTFDNFDSADNCAKEIAIGKYPDLAPAGEYISMR
jgi:hypothetical protein